MTDSPLSGMSVGDRLTNRFKKRHLTSVSLSGMMAYSVKRPNIVEALDGVKIVDLVCGEDHVLAMTDKNEILSWGRSDCGQGGHGEFRHDSLPRPIEALSKKRVRQTFCGAHHTMALTEMGELFVWGSNAKGQLGIGALKRLHTPKIVAPLRKSHVLQVACGANHTLALTSAREVITWGSNTFGQLGHRDTKDRPTPENLHMLNGIDVKQLLAGENHSAALTSFGEIYTWGRGEFGALGHGDGANRKAPESIKALQSAQTSMNFLACGADHMIGITYNNDVFAWGRNVFGQLGIGNKVDQLAPTRVPALENYFVQQVACGAHHCVALTEDRRTVLTWGRGELGQLGHTYAKTTVKPEPVKHLDGAPFSKVICGLNHTMVLSDSGKVYTWGRGSYGQLGHGTGLPKMPEPMFLNETSTLTPNRSMSRTPSRNSSHKKARSAALAVGRAGSCPPQYSPSLASGASAILSPLALSQKNVLSRHSRSLAGTPAPEELASELKHSLTLPTDLQQHLPDP